LEKNDAVTGRTGKASPGCLGQPVTSAKSRRHGVNQPWAIFRKVEEIHMNAQRCYLTIVLLGLAAGVHRVTAQTGVSPPSMETNMPSDIDPQSGFRLPLPRREDLDEAGRSAYDRAITPGRTIAGLQGPAGVQL
jgi:hypothetical protein